MRRLASIEGIKMKIKVIKKATKAAKPSGWCPVLIDDIDAGGIQK
jgi:hypothetical protein